ncbi:MAG TPA: transglutaminaseTgpA domain-containing protein [Candidatus Limnocylindrales bacterium]|nr:transglutaminaseTgpA domain-containing protein [Candidatus Limnocylindrales bacterium]
MASLMRRLRLPASPIEQSVEARAFVFSAFAVAALAIVLYGVDYVVPIVGVVASAAGHVVSYRERNLRRGFWRQALLAALIFGALFYVIADSSLALFGGTLPQANFAILLVAITSFDLKTRRNCYSSLWISLAIVYLAAVYAWDYEFAILLALWLLYLVGFWIASHLRRIDAGVRVPARAMALMLGAALVGGMVLFVVLPQPAGAPISPVVISLPNFTSFKGDMESAALPLVQLTGDSTGATTSVDLHFRGRLGTAPVMYVRTGAPAYWRGLVFDVYRNGVWTASDHFYRQTEPYVPPRLLPQPPGHNLGTFVQTFHVLRPLPGVIYAAYPLQSLYAPVAALREDAYGTFHTPDQLRPGVTYSAVSYIPDLSPQSLRADENEAVFEDPNGANLDYGSLSQPARALAADVVTGTTNEFDTVLALTRYLQRRYTYTLDLSPVPSRRDPVDWFLFDVKRGYCEQFATAEALMLRSLNIPARLVTGYSTGDYDPILNQAVVRERDAHAWVEVWFPNHGWVPVDPTPGVSALAATRFPSHWAAGGVAHLIPHLTVSAPAAALGSLGAFGVIPAGIAIAAILVVAYAWLRRRMRLPRRKAEPGESELLRLYARVQRKMRRRRAPPETPLEYEEAMRSLLLKELTQAVNEGAYAGRWPAPERVREMARGVLAKSSRRL